MNLDEAITQLIELGEKDPLEIARKIEQRNDASWLATEILAYAQDLIADMARRRLTASRRAEVAKIRAGSGIDKSELALQSLWVPNYLGEGISGWKPVADCTPEDFEAVATSREGLALAVLRQAHWFAELAARMRHEGAGTFREFRGEVPELEQPVAKELEAAL